MKKLVFITAAAFILLLVILQGQTGSAVVNKINTLFEPEKEVVQEIEGQKEITDARLNEGKNLNIIDVRESDEVAQGIIPNAIHIPLGEIENRQSELNRDISYVMVCKAGGRSGMACEILSDSGFDVTNMTGGMMAWEGEVEFR